MRQLVRTLPLLRPYQGIQILSLGAQRRTRLHKLRASKAKHQRQLEKWISNTRSAREQGRRRKFPIQMFFCFSSIFWQASAVQHGKIPAPVIIVFYRDTAGRSIRSVRGFTCLFGMIRKQGAGLPNREYLTQPRRAPTNNLRYIPYALSSQLLVYY